MSKYVVNHKCGHQVEYNLCGPYAERDRRFAYLQTIDCPECRKAAAHDNAIKRQTERGLCDLDGTEKQISWATTIREQFYTCLDTVLSRKGEDKEADVVMEFWANKLDGQTKAAWWIDNRHHLANNLYDFTSAASSLRGVFGLPEGLLKK